MALTDSISLAYRTVRSNKLRTGITVTIISLGITALIGIITAIQALNISMRKSFSSMGANGFSITYKDRFRFNRNDNSDDNNDNGNAKRKAKKSNLDKYITLREAELFKATYNMPGLTSIAFDGTQDNEVHYQSKKTNPNIRISGGDENYLEVNGYTLSVGRSFNKIDVESGRGVCILGNNVANKLFGENTERAVEKVVTINGYPYRVLGVLEVKGSSGPMGNRDNIVLTTYNNLRRTGNFYTASFSIGITTQDVSMIDASVAEATAVFRAIRKLTPTDKDNFVIVKSDRLAEMFLSNLSGIQAAAGAIGFITLIGAAIGLMNIMLVAVTERTKEVGLIKALGGKRKNIFRQFIFESTIISIMGAVIGILLGVALGNIISFLLKSGFFVPWGWVIFGITVCTGVGLLAGLWPAIKASKLNPITALRYE
ncbi:MAG: ABC transporter permease [Chitinophagaceae bacterium]|jgi:putative ABC transport system permease protein|nr:ABC transporter permease [Chitinophagaceae bacterium]